MSLKSIGLCQQLHRLLLLLQNGKVKLADFGVAKIIDKMDENVKLLHTAVGTPLLCPPQILRRKRFSVMYGIVQIEEDDRAS